jgi:hypothetical protein
MRQGLPESPRSLRISLDHLSETTQVTDTERLTWPSAASRAQRAPLCGMSFGFVDRNAIHHPAAFVRMACYRSRFRLGRFGVFGSMRGPCMANKGG